MRRLLLRILIVLAAIIGLAALVVQIVLWTNVPRNIVVRQLETQLHMRVLTGSLSTTWFGHTTLHDVSFSLPLADHPVLSMETLKVSHTCLIPLLLGEDLTISRLELQKPAIRIVRTGDGRWNVEQLAALLNRGKSKSPDASPPLLPTVELVDGTIEVIDGSRQATIDGLNFKGEPDGAIAWKLNLSIGDRVRAAGRLAPGGGWEHEATLKVSDVAPWFRPWIALPSDLSADARWRGRLTPAGVRGRLDAPDVKAGGWNASGALDVAQQEDAIEVHPDHLRITAPSAALNSVTALSGAVRYQKNVIRAQSLQLNVYGGPATLTGYYDLAARDGELTAGWDKLALPGGILHGGNLTLSVHRPFPTQIVAEGTLFSYATTPQGPWRATLNFGGQGDAQSDFAWHLNASELAWNRRTPIRLDGLALLGSIHRATGAAPTLTLASAHLADAQAMSGSGFYNFADRSWAMKFWGNRFPLQVIQNAAIGFHLDAAGNASVVNLNTFTLTQAESSLSVKGTYRYGLPKPVSATVSFSSTQQDEAETGSPQIVQGAIHGATVLEGTLLPLQLNAGGQLFGRAVRVAGRELGDVALKLTGEVNPEHAQIETERLRALGGEWSLRATYAFAEQLLDADLKVGGLPLEDVESAANAKLVSGTLAGEWDAYVLSFPLNPRNIRLTGQGWIHGLGCEGLGADDVHFTMTMDNGLLSVDPITFASGTEGRGSASLEWDIRQPRRLEGMVALSDWPLENAVGSATVKLDVPAFAIDLPQAATGSTPVMPLQIMADAIKAQIALRTEKEQIGNLTLAAEINGQFATLDDLHGSLLDAPVSGSAFFNLARPLQSHGSLTFEKLDAGRLVKLFPEAKGLSGSLHGTASLGPATAEHPLEPLSLHTQTAFDHGSFRGLRLGILNLNAFMNTDRAVLDDRPGNDSNLQIAGGSVRLWGRVGRPAPDVLSSQLEMQLTDLDLNQIMQAAKPGKKPTPGKLSGNVMLLYNSRSGSTIDATPSHTTRRAVSPAVRKFIDTLYGEGRLELKQSDIATVPIFADLYNLMSLGQAGRGPIGYGSADLRMENGTLFVTEISYFNRGIDARVRLRSPQMWDFPDNPVSGTAVGSAQPLAALKLPLVADLSGAGCPAGKLHLPADRRHVEEDDHHPDRIRQHRQRDERPSDRRHQ